MAAPSDRVHAAEAGSEHLGGEPERVRGARLEQQKLHDPRRLDERRVALAVGLEAGAAPKQQAPVERVALTPERGTVRLEDLGGDLDPLDEPPETNEVPGLTVAQAVVGDSTKQGDVR